MICYEKKTEDLQIAKYERTVCGAVTEYILAKSREDVYSVTVIRNGEIASAAFEGRFFDIADLFKKIVETDTLPENIYDISEDFKYQN